MSKPITHVPNARTTPIEQKRRRGNPGKRPLPAHPAEDGATAIALPMATGVPEPARPLGTVGQDMWNRTWRSGARWVSPDTDAELLLVLCEQMDERVALRAKLMSGEGDWHDRNNLRALDSQVVGNLCLLGFTPSDRTRLGVAEVVAQSTLEKLRANRANAAG